MLGLGLECVKFAILENYENKLERHFQNVEASAEIWEIVSRVFSDYRKRLPNQGHQGSLLHQNCNRSLLRYSFKAGGL